MEKEENSVYPRVILGLDVSTACIGVCVIKDNGDDTPEILKLTHVSPKIPGKIKGFEALCLRGILFEKEFIPTLKEYNITDIIIEGPLLSSNNTNTVGTLLRFNGIIAFSLYRVLGIVPKFISSFDARTYSFPELVCLRKYNKRGQEYPLKHIKSAIEKDNIVLFGAYPFDIDKKTVMMDKVNEKYPGIEWVYNSKGELKKENYDACDSLICALAYVNINHYGIEKPTISSYSIAETPTGYQITYGTKIWNKTYSKTLTIKE